MKILLILLLGFSLSVPTFADESLDNTAAPQTEETYEITIGDSDDVEIQVQYLNYNFGPTLVNTTRSARFFLRNNGRFPFLINDIDTDGNRFAHQENCPGFLWPGQRCSIRVFFRPNRVGLFFGRLEINLTGREDIIVNLRGRGVWGF